MGRELPATNQVTTAGRGHRAILVLLVLLAFAVSALQCWLNPRPGFMPYLKPAPHVAFLWQYNSDSGFEMATARDFPFSLHHLQTRINRPLFPALVRGLSEVWYWLVRPLKKLSADQRTGAGYVSLKIFINLLFALAAFSLLRRYLGDDAALLAVGLMLMQKFVLFRISMYHTYDLEYATPVFVAFLLQRLCDRYSLRRNILYSLAVGLLLLGRQNYGAYLAALGFGAYLRRYKDVVVSGLAHLLPLGIWVLILWFMGLHYKNYEADVYNQGSWLYKTFIYLGPLQMLKALQDSVLGWFTLLTKMHQGLWLLLGLAGLCHLGWKRGALDRDLLVFIGLCLFFNWVQLFTAGYYHKRMAADVWWIFFGGSAHLICAPLAARPGLRRKVIAGLLAAVLLWNVFIILHLPWVHPFAQKGG